MAATRPGDIPRDRIAQAINTLPTQVAGSRAGSDSGGEENAGGAASSALGKASDTEHSGGGDHGGSVKGAYPVVMLSYLIGCQEYKDAS
ncbi:phosphate ABC transporter substrate-binding protein PstS, partial [Actinotignum timonense]|nr:phosphate ABC transporter substrate-binding protein PstS [Actinotignum timonense]